MVETILIIFIFILCAIGLSDMIHSIWLMIIKPKTKCKKVLLCFLTGEYADMHLRFAYEEMLWYGNKYAEEIIGIDQTTDETVQMRCQCFAENKGIKLIKENELYKIGFSEM